MINHFFKKSPSAKIVYMPNRIYGHAPLYQDFEAYDLYRHIHIYNARMELIFGVHGRLGRLSELTLGEL